MEKQNISYILEENEKKNKYMFTHEELINEVNKMDTTTSQVLQRR